MAKRELVRLPKSLPTEEGGSLWGKILENGAADDGLHIAPELN